MCGALYHIEVMLGAGCGQLRVRCALHTECLCIALSRVSACLLSSVCSVQLSLRVHRYPLGTCSGVRLASDIQPHVELRVSALYMYRV